MEMDSRIGNDAEETKQNYELAVRNYYSTTEFHKNILENLKIISQKKKD
jgi:hypothetical protein